MVEQVDGEEEVLFGVPGDLGDEAPAREDDVSEHGRGLSGVLHEEELGHFDQSEESLFAGLGLVQTCRQLVKQSSGMFGDVAKQNRLERARELFGHQAQDELRV